ncbi:hypothetical protein CAEBREN_11902 [Caenorhabditis brenneri]|uniref:Uncharacterized protein n=1 Tax=Caenorhabditis brenneri TaxID=135651 RepID=G0P1L9_CAEBE|nr:hypothetical protein CAEBREN_11902 [Caenorhabditis brenneri]
MSAPESQLGSGGSGGEAQEVYMDAQVVKMDAQEVDMNAQEGSSARAGQETVSDGKTLEAQEEDAQRTLEEESHGYVPPKSQSRRAAKTDGNEIAAPPEAVLNRPRRGQRVNYFESQEPNTRIYILFIIIVHNFLFPDKKWEEWQTTGGPRLRDWHQVTEMLAKEKERQILAGFISLDTPNQKKKENRTMTLDPNL